MTPLATNDLLIFSGLFLVAVAGLMAVVRWANRKAAIENAPVPAFRVMQIVSSALFFTVTVAGYIATTKIVSVKERLIREETDLTVAVLRIALESSIGKFNAAAASLAGSPWIRPLCVSGNRDNLNNANSVLDRYCSTYGAAVVYVLDSSGTTIASSNRGAVDSFVGKNYAFRPYFRGAKRGEHHGYFAVGITSGKRGYYRGAPVTDSTGKVVGVVVVKDGLQTLDSIFASFHDAFLVDVNGMVFLSSDSGALPRPLFPLDEKLTKNSSLEVQYGHYSPEPLLTGKAGSNDEAVKGGRTYIYSKVNIGVPGWQVVQLLPKSPVIWYHIFGYLITTVVILLMLVVIGHIAMGRIKIWVELVSLSERQFRTIFENAPEPIIISEVDTGNVVAANPLAYERLEDVSAPVRIGEVFTKDDTGRIVVPLEAGVVQGMFRQKGAEGKQRHVSVSSAPLRFRGKSCIVSFLRDVTEYIEAREALETSELRYREITEFLPEGVFEVNDSGFFTYANKCALELFGYRPEEFACGIRPLDVVVPEDRERTAQNIERLMHTNVPSHQEYTAMCKDGRRFPVLVHSTAVFRDGKPVGFRGVAIDLTERKKMEQDLQKKDKLDALGILAGGIAHDFNNILTVIWSGFSVVKMRSMTPDDTIAILGDMDKAIRRGKDLTGQLLTYAKGGAPVKTAASLEELVMETAAFVTSGSNVRYRIEADADLHAADVDPTQISQVIQNLIINAIEAMPQGGEIFISLRNTDGSPYPASDARTGHYVEISISDTGYGIPESIQSRVFDPFFSTKPNGSGLGLATAYSIVKNHDGRILFDSVVGKGTTFHVLLPSSVKTPVRNVSTGGEVRRGNGRILLMDDEPTILTVTSKLLSMLGYTVEMADSGETAIAALIEAMGNGKRFDIVILDLTVPGGMGGRDAVKRIREIDPHIKTVVSSGYSNDPIMANFTEYGFDAVIAKPYDIQKLSAVIQALVD